MNTTTHQPDTACRLNIQSDATWDALYHALAPMVRNWVFRAGVPSWRGQELDVAWDILQTGCRKTFEYALKAQTLGIAIASLERLSVVICRNQLRDFRRKDIRLTRIEHDADSPGAETPAFYRVDDPAETVLEQIYEEQLFREVARAVLFLPPKTRLAVLVDIATRMQTRGELNGAPSPLRRAFIAVGVHLEDFAGRLPVEPQARARHASLVSLGFKRLGKIVQC
ncbi:MAG TPA: hypothetical protein VGF67_03140 [Ktedonobacteraceae bacterium]|jgi:DNA-directed RNA polymerase specialized sigma24 family protein